MIKSDNTQFETFSIDNRSMIQASHMYISTQSEREMIADELFNFIDTAYDEIGGFKSFKDIEHFISDSYLWYITYDGAQPNTLADFDIRKVYVVSVFRKRFGLKMVGLARRKIARDERDKEKNNEIRRNANSAVIQHIKFISKIGWAEVSGELEKFFRRALTIYDIIDPYDLKDYKVFRNMTIDMDEFHYARPLREGEKPITKIAYGNIKF